MKLLLFFLTMVPLTDAWAWASQLTVNNNVADIKVLRSNVMSLTKVTNKLRQDYDGFTSMTNTLKQQNDGLTGQLRDLKQENGELTVNLTAVRDRIEELRSYLTRVTKLEVLVLISPISIRW